MTQEEKAKAYDEALVKAKKYIDDGYTVLMPDLFPQLRESEDEIIRKKLIETIGYFRSRGIDQQLCEEFLTYLEKQKEIPEKEYVFRPLAGTDITIAAEQAIRRAMEGDHLVLAFNGWYVPVDNHATVRGLVDSYDTFIEKQKEEKLDSIRIKCKEHDERREEIRVTEIIESIIRVYGNTQGEFIAGYDMNTLIHWVREAFDCLNKQNIQKEKKPIESYYHEYNPDDYEVVMDGNATGLRRKEQKPTLNWRTIEEATTKRTDEGDCVTTEKMLIKGLIDDEDYRIVDKDVMVNKNLLCIPVSELNAEEQKSCDDLDSEIKRFFDECIVVHEAEIYGRKERVIEVENYELTARHFANWQKEQKPINYAEERKKCKECYLYFLNKYVRFENKQKSMEWSAYDKATLEYIIEDIKELRDYEDDEEEKNVYERELNLLRSIRESINLLRYTNSSIEWREEDEDIFEDILLDMADRREMFNSKGEATFAEDTQKK